MNSTRFPGDRAVAAERRPGPRSRLYLRRHYGWFIELMFKELKSGLGFHQYRFGNFEAVGGWAELAGTAVLYLGGDRARRVARRDPGGEQGKGGGPPRADGVFPGGRRGGGEGGRRV